MKLEEYKKQLKKKHPKAFIDKNWIDKIMSDVFMFSMDVGNHIDWKKKKWDGTIIEENLWKLLKKVRRLK